MYNVQIVNAQEVKGDKTLDMSKRYFSDTFGGRKYHKSATATASRMDLLVMENWYIGELSPLELYDFGGGNVVKWIDHNKLYLIDLEAEMANKAQA